MKIEREYYLIAEAAKIIGCTENDLIHLAARGKLDIWMLPVMDAVVTIDVSCIEKDFVITEPDATLVITRSECDLVGTPEPLKVKAKYWLLYEANYSEKMGVWSNHVLIDPDSFMGCKTETADGWMDIKTNKVGKFVVMSGDINRICNGESNDDIESGISSKISGPTFAKLQSAIDAYPKKYAGGTPKLDDDVRPWLKTAHGCTVREAEVFGAIIAEHFGLK